MSYGMKVSKPGYDVKSTSNDNLALSTEFPVLRVYWSGVVSADEEKSHDLGYAPYVERYRYDEWDNSTIQKQSPLVGIYTDHVNVSQYMAPYSPYPVTDTFYVIFY